MKVIKKINNNFAVCIDGKGNELIASGIGIGFPKIPYELNDMSKIDRTFYVASEHYISLLSVIPKEFFDISAIIVDYAIARIPNELPKTIVFTLADHIYFSVERVKKNMYVKIPYSGDIENLYENEMDIALKAIKCINKKFNIHLSREEAVGIALHFINAESINKTTSESVLDSKVLIEKMTKIIEKHFGISIERDNFNYSRFYTHMQYLLKRIQQKTTICTNNESLFETLKKEYNDVFECALKLRNFTNEQMNWVLADEELMYLMLHINRLCTREDCNR